MQNKCLYDIDECVIAFQRGEEKGFDFFFRQLFPALCFFANRMINDKCEAEDIASAAFIKIWKKHKQFNNASSIKAYLYQIVRNDCVSFHRKKSRITVAQKEIVYLSAADRDDSYEKDLIRAEFYNELYNTIDSLPPKCRIIFAMLYKEGKTVKEIAQKLDLSESTVKAQKARGLTAFRKKIILPLLLFISMIFFC